MNLEYTIKFQYHAGAGDTVAVTVCRNNVMIASAPVPQNASRKDVASIASVLLELAIVGG